MDGCKVTICEQKPLLMKDMKDGQMAVVLATAGLPASPAGLIVQCVDARQFGDSKKRWIVLNKQAGHSYSEVSHNGGPLFNVKLLPAGATIVLN